MKRLKKFLAFLLSKSIFFKDLSNFFEFFLLTIRDYCTNYRSR